MSRNRAKAMLAMGIVGAFALTACSGANTSGGTVASGKSGGGGALNVLMVLGSTGRAVGGRKHYY